jgi:hypothetical protein
MKKTLLLGMVLIARVAFAADLGAIDAWQDEAIEPPETVYVDPRLSPLGAQEHHHYHPTLEEAPPSERNAESLSSVCRCTRAGVSRRKCRCATARFVAKRSSG